MAEPPDLNEGIPDAGYERLKRDYASLQEQFAATSEILTALGRAGADPSVILDTIVERAGPLCGADISQLYLVDNGGVRVSRICGAAPREFIEHVDQHPLEMTRASLMGRVALDRRS